MPIREPEAEYFPGSFGLQDLPEAALGALSGVLGSALSKEARTNIIQHWLIWSQGNSADVRRQWSYLLHARAISDRDRYVLDLWKSIDREGGANNDSRKQIAEEVAPWDYYRRHFFGWFLGRFNLPAARQVFSDRWFVRNLHTIFVAISLAAVLGALWGGKWEPHLACSLNALLAVSGLLLCGLACWIWRLSLPVYAFTYSLVPRLGVAVGIGYLFLSGAPHLVRAIAGSEWVDWKLYTASLVLVIGTFFYVPVHISRRVYPPPPWKLLFRRSRGIVALGVGYAALELLFFAPFFFTSAFLDLAEFQKGPPQLILCGSIALILGVILQLAWDEKPMTEPL
jgi:hypothetical protein